MKTYIYRTLFIGVLVSSYLTHSQIRPNNNRGEYLRLDEVKDLKKRSTGETEFEDFSFNWNNGFHTALNNLALLEKVQVANLMSWHRKQFNLMKAEIEKQLNTSFNNYNQAKKAFFSSIERENITKNTPVILSKYERLYNSGKRKNRRYLRQLKFLKLRKIELREGNINNSQFSYIEVNGISLKEITLLSTLLKLESNIENAFENQISRNYEYRHTIEKLDYLGSSFERKMFRLKHEYYNGFSEWDKLGLMQFLLNYEHYKDIINCMVCILPDALLKFRNSDMATQPVIEEYAKSSSGYNVSLFDPRYPRIHRFKYQNNLCGGRIDLMAWEADKKAALDALVDDVSTADFNFRNFVEELDLDINDYKSDYKNHTLSHGELTMIHQKLDFIYSKINTVSKESINQLSLTDQQIVIQDILFVTMFPGIKYLHWSNQNLISDFSNDIERGEVYILNKYLELFQNTPISFSKLWDNYDNIKGTHLLNENKEDFSNYCAINLSHALLNTGIILNNFKGVKCWGCKNIKNNKKHAIRAQELANWLKNDSSNINGIEEPVFLTGNNFENFIDGKKGIIFFKDYWQRDSDIGTNRSGDHIDLWDGNELAGSTWFWTRFRLNLPWVAERFGSSDLSRSSEVIFWEIKY
jgi:hypothetical protein